LSLIAEFLPRGIIGYTY